jgi:hypothetical protein
LGGGDDVVGWTVWTMMGWAESGEKESEREGERQKEKG